MTPEGNVQNKTAASVSLNDEQGEILKAFISASRSVGTLSGTVVRALEDKKITGSEALQIVLATPAVVETIKPVLKVARQFMYLTNEQQTEITAAFAAEFDITNDQAEAQIENLISTAVAVTAALEKFISALRTFRKKTALGAKA